MEPSHRRPTALWKTLACALLALAMLCSAWGVWAEPQETTAPQPQPADLVLQHGRIYTADIVRSTAQALAIRNGRIVHVGTDGSVAAWTGPSTKVVDLGGRLVLPGFIDSHMHPSLIPTLSVEGRINGASMADYQREIARLVRENPGRPALVTIGWRNTVVPRRGPTREQLDAVVKDIPAAVFSEDGHSIWVNSKTIELLGFTSKTPDPPGGRIERDPRTNEPSGTMREWGAQLPVMKLLMNPTREEIKPRLVRILKHLNSLGITTVHDAALMAETPSLDILEQLAETGDLTVRVRGAFFALPGPSPETQVAAFRDARGKYRTDLFRIDAIKVFMDGVIEGHTALLAKPYADRPREQGLTMWPQDKLTAFVTAAHRGGFQVHFHAIGDQASHLALDALQYAAEHGGGFGHRDLITHLQLVDPADIRRFFDLGVIAIPNPLWHVRGAYYRQLQVPYLGEARAAHEYPMKSFVDAGVLIAAASDMPASPDPNPLLGIQTGILRWAPTISEGKAVLWPEERLPPWTLVDAFTINGAYANFLEKETGSLEVGKSADLAVLDQDIFQISPKQYHKVKVLLTLLRGRTVHAAPPFEPGAADRAGAK